MSKREKLSGCQYRLLAKSKAAKQEELISKTKKLDTFFFQKSENKQSQINNDLDKQSENNSDSILNVSQFSATDQLNNVVEDPVDKQKEFLEKNDQRPNYSNSHLEKSTINDDDNIVTNSISINKSNEIDNDFLLENHDDDNYKNHNLLDNLHNKLLEASEHCVESSNITIVQEIKHQFSDKNGSLINNTNIQENYEISKKIDFIQTGNVIKDLASPSVSNNIISCTEDHEISPHLACISNDPALWIINNETIDEIISRGFQQNKEADFSKSKKIIYGHTRSMQKSLFTRTLKNGTTQNREWLIYSKSSCSIFCGPCTLFKSSCTLAKGYSDWANAYKMLTEHERSWEHSKNCIHLKNRFKALKDNLGINKQLNQQLLDEFNYWRKVLRYVVAVIKKLTSRGLPLRGANEVFGSFENGNFCMSLELIAEFDPFLREHIRVHGNKGSGFTSYLSSATYTEILKIMAEFVLQKIIDEILLAIYFSISVDSTPDISHVDQLTFIIRYVNKDGVVERFLKFIPNCDHSGESIANIILETLKSYGINIKNCRGQSFDNASNMSGIYTGVQAQIAAINPLAEWIPCTAHSLNLVGKNSVDSNPIAANFFFDVQELYNFFSSSTNRWDKLHNRLTATVKSLSITRWSAKYDAVKTLADSYKIILEVLFKISQDQKEKTKTRSEAKGLHDRLNCLETCIITIVWNDILERFHAVSTKLQSTKTELCSAVDLYESLIEYLSFMKPDFENYETKAIRKLGISVYKKDITRPRKRKAFHDERNSEDVREMRKGSDDLRIEFFNEILSALINNLEKRLVAYKNLDKVFGFLTKLHLIEHEDIEKQCQKLILKYKDDLEESLINECKHVGAYLIIKKIDKISALDLYNLLYKNDLLDICPNLDIILRIYLSLMISNCTGERSFSALRRVHNYLRSTQEQESLNAVSILFIERDLALQLDYDTVIDKFAAEKARKKVFTK